jgi:enediyne biosynthesis protein E4
MRAIILISALLNCAGLFAQGFNKLSEKESGIEFTNSIYEDDTINGLSYLYLYNGGGVAIGDINNDGLEDVYFTGNQMDDKLYLNQGNLKFKDVTKKYFKKQKFDFHTGATMVDINNDGWLDIYVSAAGYAYNGEDRRNKMFINKGGKKFVDEAASMGLDDSLNTTQAAFFDADNDGDLDVYLLNHVYLRKNTQYFFELNKMRKYPGHDKLLINENGKFTDKSKDWGISSPGYGQGIVVSDFNQDGWQDIYVANDFEDADRLYMNTGKEKFNDELKSKTMHLPLFSMGADAGDINNDGLMDLMTVDMANADHVKSKKNMGGMSSENFWKLVNNDQHYQYMYNALQLNLGHKFIDIGQMSGMSKTDWSWSPLFADFDNDGFQDLYVSNGYLRDLRDNDFTIKYDRGIQISKEFKSFDEIKELIPTSKTHNYIYQNNGDLTFDKKSNEWGLEELINVNGAAYADLDNDGDLDLVCNASDEASFIMENVNDHNHYLKIKLINKNPNQTVIGSRVEIYIDDKSQVREIQSCRGFQSSSSQIVHFGIGINKQIDSIIVRHQGVVVFKKEWMYPQRIFEIDLSNADLSKTKSFAENKEILAQTDVPGLSARHVDFSYDDFEKEVLLPHKMSQIGPIINVDDINDDGLDDLYMPAAKGSNGYLFIQDSLGKFNKKTLGLFKTNFLSEEISSTFIDADNDGDQDIYVCMGSNEAPNKDASYQDQLFINDGKENFVLSNGLLPELNLSGQKVIVKDLNSDGWLDLVVFGRQTPEAYPSPPNSHILINNEGKFEDQTASIAPGFEELGMVTDAIFSNIDDDSAEELIIVGEWMPVTIFDWQNNVLKNTTTEMGLDQTVGWWNTIEYYKEENGAAVFMLGNLGLNNKYHPSIDKPLHVYMADFDDNGTNDIVLAKSQNDILYPVRGRQCSSQQMPFVAQKFSNYDLFAKADVEDIYTQEKLDSALHIELHTFANSILKIDKDVSMVVELPEVFQTGPINQFLIDDFNADGSIDIFSFGNKFEAEIETIRYDGNPSLFLDGNSPFYEAEMLGIIENIKSADTITIIGETYILLGINNSEMKVYKVKI